METATLIRSASVSNGIHFFFFVLVAVTSAVVGAEAEIRAAKCDSAGHCFDIRTEPIAVLRQRFDPLRSTFPERLAQRRDLKCQVGLFHEGVRPQRRHQLVLRERAAPLCTSSSKRSNVFGASGTTCPSRVKSRRCTSSVCGPNSHKSIVRPDMAPLTKLFEIASMLPSIPKDLLMSQRPSSGSCVTHIRRRKTLERVSVYAGFAV